MRYTETELIEKVRAGTVGAIVYIAMLDYDDDGETLAITNDVDEAIDIAVNAADNYFVNRHLSDIRRAEKEGTTSAISHAYVYAIDTDRIREIIAEADAEGYTPTLQSIEIDYNNPEYDYDAYYGALTGCAMSLEALASDAGEMLDNTTLTDDEIAEFEDWNDNIRAFVEQPEKYISECYEDADRVVDHWEAVVHEFGRYEEARKNANEQEA